MLNPRNNENSMPKASLSNKIFPIKEQKQIKREEAKRENEQEYQKILRKTTKLQIQSPTSTYEERARCSKGVKEFETLANMAMTIL